MKLLKATYPLVFGFLGYEVVMIVGRVMGLVECILTAVCLAILYLVTGSLLDNQT